MRLSRKTRKWIVIFAIYEMFNAVFSLVVSNKGNIPFPGTFITGNILLASLGILLWVFSFLIKNIFRGIFATINAVVDWVERGH